MDKYDICEIKWRIEGPFDSSYSLALVNREIARALSALGVDVALFSTEGPGDYKPSVSFLEANPDLFLMNKRADIIPHKNASVTSRNLYPPRVEDMTSRVNLMHSFAWEESSFPVNWVRNFNNHLTGMTCMSRHVLRVMQDNGVHIPMTISGIGVDHWERVEPSKDSILDKVNTKTFRFLHVSSFFPRKGPEALLNAYGKAFIDADDITLVIKTFPNPHNWIHEQLKVMHEKYPNYPHVIVIEDDLSDSDLKALYQRCHVMVAPSCAEGFGLPLAEAMLSGLPVITTNWSGQLDFCTKKNSWLVDYRFEQADSHFNLRPSAWAAINVDSLSSTMKEAYSTPDEVRRAMAQSGKELLLQEFTWIKVAHRLVEFYKMIDTFKSRSPLLGWVSTWNCRCGIATYSKHLISGMKNRPFILAARTEDTRISDGDTFLRCWNACDSDNLDGLAQTIDEKALEVIVIQFNFGFFHHDHLLRFIKLQKKAGRLIVIDMHATNDPPQTPHKKLFNYIPALALADRLLLHSIADMNQVKNLGLQENLVLFPHGCLEPMPLASSGELNTPTIATYGFALPHKGLEQVIEAVGILRDAGNVVKLNMINAEYPAAVSTKLLKELRSKVKKLNLGDQVKINSQFLSDEMSLAMLQKADLILFVYHPTSESASGAVRYGLASGKPTLVTDLPVFSELGDAVWRVANNNPKLLAETISDVFKHIQTKSEDYQRKQQVAERWCEQHRYSWLSERLNGMLQSLWMLSTPVVD